MESKTVYDIIGIGIGPFNLGMAALADSIPDLKCLFFDESKEFNWHPGMMLDNARLQVPFYADLVTLADPCSRFSFLAFLKAKQRMFRFAILENNFILRKEYNEYCRWVAGQLPCLRFGFRCEAIRYDDAGKIYVVYVRDVSSQMGYVYYCKHLVLGVGTVPYIPDCAAEIVSPYVIHSSDYLYFKELLLTKKAVTIVGSGQSAAEIFYDLLQHHAQLSNGLNWFTRAERFYPMEYSKLSLEMTSPDYVEYFYGLSPEKKAQTLSKQDMLYKGINYSLINAIYDELYLQRLSETNQLTRLFTHFTLKDIKKIGNDGFELSFHHAELDQYFTHKTETIIMATGYQYYIPDFIKPIKDLIEWTPDPSAGSPQGTGQAGQAQYQVNRNYSIDSANSIFIQNAELHTHGFNAPDLGMGPYRNAVILNCILGYEHFVMEKNIAFQKFGVPPCSPHPKSLY